MISLLATKLYQKLRTPEPEPEVDHGELVGLGEDDSPPYLLLRDHNTTVRILPSKAAELEWGHPGFLVFKNHPKAPQSVADHAKPAAFEAELARLEENKRAAEQAMQAAALHDLVERAWSALGSVSGGAGGSASGCSGNVTVSGGTANPVEPKTEPDGQWKSADGRVIKISELSNSHLINIWKMAIDSRADWGYQLPFTKVRLKEEIRKRGLRFTHRGNGRLFDRHYLGAWQWSRRFFSGC